MGAELYGVLHTLLHAGGGEWRWTLTWMLAQHSKTHVSCAGTGASGVGQAELLDAYVGLCCTDTYHGLLVLTSLVSPSAQLPL